MSKLPSWTDEDILAEKCADRILDNMCSPEIDTAYGEDLWEEIIRVLGIPNVRERMDAIEDLTLHDLMKKAAERRVDRTGRLSMNHSPADDNRNNPQPPPQDEQDLFYAWAMSQADQESSQS